jgi:hypothetical protein
MTPLQTIPFSSVALLFALTQACTIQTTSPDPGGSAGSPGASGGAGASGSGAPGSGSSTAALPADLVGKWTSTDGSTGIVYVFKADGTYTEDLLYLNSGECLAFSKMSITESGSVVAGPVMTTTAATHTERSVDCSGMAKTSTYTSNEPEKFRWSVAAGKLTMTDNTNNTVTYSYSKQ